MVSKKGVFVKEEFNQHKSNAKLQQVVKLRIKFPRLMEFNGKEFIFVLKNKMIGQDVHLITFNNN